MDLELEDEQLELRDAASGLLDRHAPLSLARAYLDGNGDARELWAQLAELGWLGVGLDEDDPFGVPGLCLLADQIGRHAAPTTLVDTACVARIAQAAESRWLERLVSGEVTVALAMLEPGGDWMAPPRASASDGDGDFVIVSGEKTGVHHAGAASATGGSRRARRPRRQWRSSIPARRRERNGCHRTRPVVRGLRHLIERASASTARTCSRVRRSRPSCATRWMSPASPATAEGLGAASAALDLAVAYALERRAVRSRDRRFPGAPHLMAEQHVLRETAWASVLYAAAALEERTQDAAAAAAVAKAHGAAATRRRGGRAAGLRWRRLHARARLPPALPACAGVRRPLRRRRRARATRGRRPPPVVRYVRG